MKGTEFLYQEGQTIHTGFDLSWQHDRINVNEFRVLYRLDNDNFTELNTANPSITIRNLKAGTLTVEIRATNFLNKQSTAATAEFEILGKDCSAWRRSELVDHTHFK